MHLYYILMKNNIGNKKECYQLIKNGYIRVNDKIIHYPLYEVKENDSILYQNQLLKTEIFDYYMLNKPAGYISATKDVNLCVLDLFEQKDLVLSGRLDKDTTGLMILSNDKTLMKKLSLPHYQVLKTYLVKTQEKLTKENIDLCKKGIVIDRDVLCHPALLEIIDDFHCYLTIDEGKYHQVKKMFLSMNNKVLALKRIKIGDIYLDHQLKEGEYRKLSKEEIFLLKKYVK